MGSITIGGQSGALLTPPPDPIFLGGVAGISAYADQQTNAANTYLLRLGDASAALVPPVINPIFPAGPSAPGQLTQPAPTLQTVVWTSPNAPPDFTDVLDVTSVLPAPFDAQPPVLAFGSAPAAFSEIVPTAPGVDLTYVEPLLSLTLPSPPSLLSLNITSFAGLNMPTAIDPNAIPTLTAVEPTLREYVPGAAYTSALLEALKTSLKDRFVNGGTGLNPAVENAIWDRGREREARSAAESFLKLDEMEAMGFSMPPGVYLDAHLKIMTEMDYANRGNSREIMIKQAELEQSNVLAALTTATQLEGELINYSNSVEQRLFESTKYATEAGIAIYNAKVQAYAAYLEAYKTKVQIYEALIRAEIAKVDAYKAQVEAESAKAQINTALVEQYKAQVEAALSGVEVYKARLSGIQIKADIEKTKIEVYGEQIKAYVAKINAYTAGVEGYRATLEAEKTKQDVYRSQVEAFSAQVTADAKQADILIAAFEGKIKGAELQLKRFEAEYSGEASRAQAISAFNSSLSDEYKAEVQAVTSYNEVLTKQWQVALDQAQRVSEIGINAAKANAEMYVTVRSLALDAAKVGAQVSAQLGAAALNAVNWSQSAGTSVSFANSNSYGESISLSDSYSHTHNENYSFSN